MSTVTPDSHLELARKYLEDARRTENNWIPGDRTHNELMRLMGHAILNYLETQQPGSISPETSSPAATETPEETKPTSAISHLLLFHVKAGGNLRSYLGPGILDWLSSLPPPGEPQEVAIRLTLTPRAATPPSGSASSSPAEEVSHRNGRAGEKRTDTDKGWQDFYSPDMGHYVCRDTGGDTPSEPCFYMPSAETALQLRRLLNSAVLISPEVIIR